jgi:recombination protein RecA
MARPADLLERLPESLSLGKKTKFNGLLRLGAAPSATQLPAGLSLGWPELEACLPDAGLARGHVVQLAALHPGALATQLALRTCAEAQQQGRAFGTDELWCAFIDPSRSLYAPGVAQAGVRLDRLLVVNPDPAALANVALRVVRAGVFAVVVIDASAGLRSDVVRRRGVVEGPHSLGIWVRAVRQMALALEGQQTGVLLITDASNASPLPLPVAQRIELRRPSLHQLELRVAKDRWGRITGWRRVALDSEANSAPNDVQKPALQAKPEARYAT